MPTGTAASAAASAAASGGAKRRESKLVGRHLGGSGRYDKGLGPHAHLVAAQGMFGRLVGKGPPAGGSVPAPAVVGGLSGSDGRLGGGPQAQSPAGAVALGGRRPGQEWRSGLNGERGIARSEEADRGGSWAATKDKRATAKCS